MIRILTVIGARPQFIKASVVSKVILNTDGIEEYILHTGQHFDENMSSVFFDQLNLPKPNVQLNINSGTHGDMTGRMLSEIEKVLLNIKPDCVLVYGDTNSTLAGALAASKLHIPVAHIEAGLRSFNMKMPEEINRILTDQISSLLFCPTDTAVNNLINEGFSRKPVAFSNVGDVMQDAALLFAPHSVAPHGSIPNEFLLATIHRAENTDNPIRLSQIVDALNQLHDTVMPVVIPLHPRTQKLIKEYGLTLNAKVLEPVGYFEMIWLIENCQLVLTDSGGLQKESFFFRKFCITLREQTEWIELVNLGVNKLVGVDKELIVSEAMKHIGFNTCDPHELYGGGKASERIVNQLLINLRAN